MIDNQIQGLQIVRAALESRDEEKLAELLKTVRNAHDDWWTERSRAEWDADISRDDIPTIGDNLLHWIGINPKKKKKED